MERHHRAGSKPEIRHPDGVLRKYRRRFGEVKLVQHRPSEGNHPTDPVVSGYPVFEWPAALNLQEPGRNSVVDYVGWFLRPRVGAHREWALDSGTWRNQPLYDHN